MYALGYRCDVHSLTSLVTQRENHPIFIQREDIYTALMIWERARDGGEVGMACNEEIVIKSSFRCMDIHDSTHIL